MKVLYIILLLVFMANMLDAQVAVIAHKSFGKDKIDKTELLDCYTGDLKKTDDGKKIQPFDLENNSETKEIFYKYLGKSPSRMKSIWMKKMLAGEGEPPQALESEEEMLKKVENTKGAIGFIDYGKVTNNIKVLAIIEKEKN